MRKESVRIAAVALLVLVVSVAPFIYSANGEKYGGTMVLAHQSEPLGANPLVWYDAWGWWSNVFSRLVAYDYRFQIMPDLAESWELSDNGLEYTFHLRQNVSWHDGVNFTSADVVWTINTVLNTEGLYYTSYLQSITDVVALDDYTVKITLSEVNADFINTLAHFHSFVILPKHLFEGTDIRENPHNWNDVVGTGPFKQVEWVKGSHTIWEANDDYFKGRPYLDRIIIKWIPTWASISLGLQSGDIDATIGPGPPPAEDELKTYPHLQIESSVGVAMIYALMNLERAPFDNVKVRHAIALAINRTDISEKAYRGYAPAAVGQWPSFLEFANPDATLPDYDPEMAKTLLDEAGYPEGPGGIRFSTTITTYMTMMVPEVAQIMKEHLALVGIDVSIESYEWSTYFKKANTDKDCDIALGGPSVGPVPDISSVLFKTGGGRNLMSYSNARVDEIYELGAGTLDFEERKSLYDELWQTIVDDMPVVALVEYGSIQAFDKEFQGFYFQPESEHKVSGYVYSKVWWAGGSDYSPEGAIDAIRSAEANLVSLSRQYYDVSAAMEELAKAKDAYYAGSYDIAVQKAQNCGQLVVPPYPLYAAVIVAIVVAAAMGVLYWTQRRKGKQV